MGRKPPGPITLYCWHEQPSYWSYMRKDGEWYYYIDTTARYETTPPDKPGWVKYPPTVLTNMEAHVSAGKLIEVPYGT